MLVGGVVDDEVDHHADAAVAGLVHQLGEVAEGADPRVNPVEVGDVVAGVLARGRVHRVQPETGDPEPGQVVEPADQAAQVADAVAVGVLEGLHVEAVEDSFLVPAFRQRRPPRLGSPGQ